jgi:hypothetical protein
MPPSRSERTLEVGEQVAQMLTRHGIRSAVIGAMAMAAYNYPRATEDFDLATDADPFAQLPAIAEELKRLGYSVALRLPDAEDSLGGVLDITGPDFDLVQVVNFFNPLAPSLGMVGRDAVAAASGTGEPGSALRLISLPHLIALKLYAGGNSNVRDVLELLTRNPDVDRQRIRELASRFDLLEEWHAVEADVG